MNTFQTPHNPGETTEPPTFLKEAGQTVWQARPLFPEDCRSSSLSETILKQNTDEEAQYEQDTKAIAADCE